jgi:hypothetical protein
MMVAYTLTRTTIDIDIDTNMTTIKATAMITWKITTPDRTGRSIIITTARGTKEASSMTTVRPMRHTTLDRATSPARARRLRHR